MTLKPRMRAVMIALVVLAWAHPSQAKLVIFGDSLSETGNFSLLTSGQLPPAPLYPQGRFTNGLVWVDYLAQELRQPAAEASLSGGTNYAFNGSRAAGISPYGTPDLQQQVAMFLSDHDGQASADDIYIIWSGANDIFFGAALQEPDFVANAVASIQQAVLTLHSAGARRFLVLNLPPLGQTPYFAESPLEAAQLDVASDSFNRQLAGRLWQLQCQLFHVRIGYVDVQRLFRWITRFPRLFQLDELNEACTVFDTSTGVSLGFALREDIDPEHTLFWDGVHPTTRTHEIIAKRARQVARMRLSPMRR